MDEEFAACSADIAVPEKSEVQSKDAPRICGPVRQADCTALDAIETSPQFTLVYVEKLLSRAEGRPENHNFPR